MLNSYEALLSDISREVPVVEGSLVESTGLEGAYRNNRIYIEKSLPIDRKKATLAEEYAHHLTSVGDIIDQNSLEARKQEEKARRVSYEMLISLDDLINCSMSGCANKFECAEYLGVSIEVLASTIKYYYVKYGKTYFHNGHILIFDEETIIVLDTKL